MVGGDEADRGTVGREQLGDPDADRAADRVPDDDRARRRLGDLPLGGEDLGGGRDGRAGRHLEAPPAGARAGAVHDRPLVAVDLLEGHLMARHDPDAAAAALGLQPVHEGRESFPPGRARGDPHHPTEAVVPLDERDLVAGRGRRRGRTRGLPGRHRRREHCDFRRLGAQRLVPPAAKGGSTSGSVVSWPERGSPMQVTTGLRTSRTRQAWLHRTQGRTRSAAPPPPSCQARDPRSGRGSSRRGRPRRWRRAPRRERRRRPSPGPRERPRAAGRFARSPPHARLKPGST